jgi:hypothetical protein
MRWSGIGALVSHPREAGAANWLAVLRAYLIATAALDLLWEPAHLPLYTIGQTGTMGQMAFAVAHCTIGDVLIALTSLAAAVVIAGDRAWPSRGFVRVALLTLTIGLGYTVFSEYRDIEVLHTWTYSELMPRLPPLGTGLSPALQWIVIPTAAFIWARRYSTLTITRTG